METRGAEAVNNFAHMFWDAERYRAGEKSLEIQRQGFIGTAMLPMAELEYTGFVEKLTALDARLREGSAG